MTAEDWRNLRHATAQAVVLLAFGWAMVVMLGVLSHP